MKDIDKFKAVVDKHDDLQLFIDHIEQEDENTITYTFDGYMSCGILYRDGKYYDLQDGTLKDDHKKWRGYDKIEEVFDRLIEEFVTT